MRGVTVSGIQVAGAVAVVTGGGSGIGRALAQRFAADGARAVVVAGRNVDRVKAVADALPVEAAGIGLDVTDEAAVKTAIDEIEQRFGPIDIYCSNAGILDSPGLGTDEQWEHNFKVHMLAHVYVARHLVPRMVQRGHGHVMITASGSGLLTDPSHAPYTATRHGSVAIAEWLAITHGGDTGVSFSCLCPGLVRTPMTIDVEGNAATAAFLGGSMEPEEAANVIVAAITGGHFLILTHPQFAELERRRADDRDRWLRGLHRAWRNLQPSTDA
jgi:NAD(P)-dependent dehydrogenase (short-subunit alcohol dehydrogenase family)